MSKLSELLNPAPSGSEISPTTSQASKVHPLVLDGRNHRTTSISYGGSPTHTRHNSITSPGLEALADVASNSAPIPSPTTQHTGSFVHPTPFPPSYSQYGSRPSSSHTALPSLSADYNQSHGTHSASHSLGQYHHQSSGERRMSDLTDSSIRPPILQQSPTHTHATFSPEARQPLSGIIDYANGVLPHHEVHETLRAEQGSIGTGEQPTKDAPSTSQIRQPSPIHSQTLSNADVPPSQSEQIEVKAEVADNAVKISKVDGQPDGQPAEESQAANKIIESPTPAIATEIKDDATPATAVDPSIAAPSKPKVPPSKKRAAPKKGTASAVKHANKKRKLDIESGEGTPSAQRSGTPLTNRASNTPVPKTRKQGSETPARSSSVLNGADDEDGSEEDTEAYCICRKPDDHTLMIGCDGPCEDWFHVRCVSMDSVKAKLISKWYCPNCAEKGLETLWKRMCRLEGCQEPARADGENRSKYCCDEHGSELMNTHLGAEKKGNDKTPSKKSRRRNNFTDNFGNQDDSPSEDPVQVRGVLKPSELKALVDGANDINAFHELGTGVLSPPPTVSPEGDDVRTGNGAEIKKGVTYTPEETAHLEEIAEKREKVRAQKIMLDLRDKFRSLVTDRAKTVLTELKEHEKSINTICGYDTRINWSDPEFNDWRASAEGKLALETGILGPPLAEEQAEKREENETRENTAPEITTLKEDEEEIGKGVCKKKRCDRHKAWLKLHQQDIMFETHQARQAMWKLEAEEKGVMDRAMIRHLEREET